MKRDISVVSIDIAKCVGDVLMQLRELLHSVFKLIAIDEQANDQIMHKNRARKTDSFSY